MKAEVILMTPEKAKELLEMNVGNRKLKPVKRFYVGQMLNGEWKENGESIIIDKNGFIKNGQHRLNAVIEANHSYKAVVVTGVEPDVMSTIDTGTNRTLNDVLQLNGFSYYSESAGLIKRILQEKRGLSSFTSSGSERGSINKYISNNQGLEFAKENKEGLHSICGMAKDLDKQRTYKVMSVSHLAFSLYLIAGFEYTDKHVQFIKRIAGIVVDPGSCTNWLFKTLLEAKRNKVRINSMWKRNAIIKCWNIYSVSDHPVKNMEVSILERSEVFIPKD